HVNAVLITMAGGNRRLLPIGDKDFRIGRLFERILTHIADDADDLTRALVETVGNRDLRSNRADAVEVTLHEGSVDDGYPGSCFGVRSLEGAALQHRNLKRFEVIRADCIEIDNALAGGALVRLAGDAKGALAAARVVAHFGKPAHHSNRADGWQGLRVL